MKTGSPELRKTIFLVAFLAAGLLLVRSGALPFTAWAVGVALVLAVRLLPRLDPPHEELELTDAGITRRYGSRLRRTDVESVQWQSLNRVQVLTHEFGPAREHMLFLLFGEGGQGVAVPAPLARQHDLPGLLARRLPGFRQDLLAQAMERTDRASFILWPEGLTPEEAAAQTPAP